MTDLAVYRSLSPSSGTISGYVSTDLGPAVIIRLKEEVSSVASVKINTQYSPDVTLLSRSQVQAVLPTSLQSRDRSTLTYRVYAQTRLLEGRTYLSALGFGPQVQEADPVTEALQRAHRWLLKSAGQDVWDREGGGSLLATALANLANIDAIHRQVDIACDRYNSTASKREGVGPRVTRVTPLEVRSMSWQDAEAELGISSASSQLPTAPWDRREASPGAVVLIRIGNRLSTGDGTFDLQNALTV